VAANFAGGGGQSFYGAAAGYGLGTGRIMASAAAGVQRANDATRGAYGGRVAATVWSSAGGALGAAAFAGIGGATRTRDGAGVVTNSATMIIPVGLTVGYRRALGATRGISGYVSPLYRWTRLQDTTVSSGGNFGVSLGVDASITQSFGATIVVELGRSGSGTARKTSSAMGLALSFVPGR
jgi:hypothetical protein